MSITDLGHLSETRFFAIIAKYHHAAIMQLVETIRNEVPRRFHQTTNINCTQTERIIYPEGRTY